MMVITFVLSLAYSSPKDPRVSDFCFLSFLELKVEKFEDTSISSWILLHIRMWGRGFTKSWCSGLTQLNEIGMSVGGSQMCQYF